MIIDKEECENAEATTTRGISMPSSTRSQRRHPNWNSWNKLWRCNNKKVTKYRSKNLGFSWVLFNSTYKFV